MSSPFNMYQEYVGAVLRCAFLEHGYHVDENAMQNGRRYALLCRQINEAPSIGVLFKPASEMALRASRRATRKRSGFVVHTVVVPGDHCRVAFDSRIQELLDGSRQGPRFLEGQQSLEPIA